jgi:hypothetical protein
MKSQNTLNINYKKTNIVVGKAFNFELSGNFLFCTSLICDVFDYMPSLFYYEPIMTFECLVCPICYKETDLENLELCNHTKYFLGYKTKLKKIEICDSLREFSLQELLTE